MWIFIIAKFIQKKENSKEKLFNLQFFGGCIIFLEEILVSLHCNKY